MFPLHFSKTSPMRGDAYSKSTFFFILLSEVKQASPRQDKLVFSQELLRRVAAYQMMFYFIVAFRQPYQTT